MNIPKKNGAKHQVHDETDSAAEYGRVRSAVIEILKAGPLNGGSFGGFQWFFSQPDRQRGGYEHPLKRFGIKNPTTIHEIWVQDFLNELFRSGALAWGDRLDSQSRPSMIGPPHFYVTDQGKKSLEAYDRDPRNPNGYLAHLKSIGELDDAELSYAEEAAWSFSAGRHRAAAVMIGVAAESLILRLAEDLHSKLDSKSPFGKEIVQGRIKGVLDQLAKHFKDEQASLKAAEGKLGERLIGGLWGSLTETIRISRNAAGHPESLTTIDDGKAWTSLVLFPDLAALVRDVRKWAGVAVNA